LRDQIELEENKIQMLCERVKAIIMAHPAPINRLSRDIENARQYDVQPGPTTAQFELLCAAPAFLPVSARIVELFVRSFGRELFARPCSFLLLALAATGPVAAAETLVLHASTTYEHDPMRALIGGLEGIFASHPEALSIPARGFLAPFMLKPPLQPGWR
jgi:hypothetical protein